LTVISRSQLPPCSANVSSEKRTLTYVFISHSAV